MSGCRRASAHLACRPSHLVIAVALGMLLAGCGTGARDITGSLPPGADRRADASDRELRARLDALADRYRANPGDPRISIDYARALRSTGQRDQATAVLQQASIRNPKDPAVLGAYGRALADSGQYPLALDVLERAHTPDQRDWRILNVQGAVMDQMGRHEDARRVYQQALTIAPDEPSVLSNLGLSHALSKELAQAEAVLRRAAGHPRADGRVRQNLALVIGLQGRFQEAEQIAAAELPPAQAEANVTYLRDMLSQPHGLRKIGLNEARASAAPARPVPSARGRPAKPLVATASPPESLPATPAPAVPAATGSPSSEARAIY